MVYLKTYFKLKKVLIFNFEHWSVLNVRHTRDWNKHKKYLSICIKFGYLLFVGRRRDGKLPEFLTRNHKIAGSNPQSYHYNQEHNGSHKAFNLQPICPVYLSYIFEQQHLSRTASVFGTCPKIPTDPPPGICKISSVRVVEVFWHKTSKCEWIWQCDNLPRSSWWRVVWTWTSLALEHIVLGRQQRQRNRWVHQCSRLEDVVDHDGFDMRRDHLMTGWEVTAVDGRR